MLTQEDFVAPIMSADANLQRSSWKAEAIRRGDLKISGPIPITEETPLSEAEEREYADKHNTEPPSIPQDSPVPPVPQSQPAHPQSPPHPPQPQYSSLLSQAQTATQDAPTQEMPEQVMIQPQARDENHDVRHKPSPAVNHDANEMQRRGPIDPAPHAPPSPFPSQPESGNSANSSSKAALKKKRKSGLRNVFRKMFGKRGRDEPHGEEPEPEPMRRGHGHHVSDPGLLRQSAEPPPTHPTKENPNGPRISDLPIAELRPLNPLGQHLPFPMNVNAPQESSPPHEYLTFEAPMPDLGRRRATLPTVLANAETQSLSNVWSGSGKRLSTWEEQNDGESLPSSPQIGIALSSPPWSVQQKRRSRSAGALRDLAKARPSTERRRSAEIRYWRNSLASGSIYSTNTARPQTARTVETVRSADTPDTAAKMPESIAEQSVTEPPPVLQHDQDRTEIQLPVEAFNFGNLRSGFSDDEDVEIPRDERRLSIEDRVRDLEDSMRTLETSVRRLSGRSNRQTIILENAPKGRRSSNRSSSAASDRQGSFHSGTGSGGQCEPERTPSPTLTPLSAVKEVPSAAHSGLAQTVITIDQRPTTSQRAELADQLAAVYDALKHERTSRKTLERQVISLQREVSELWAMVSKLTNASPCYPTPSPDAIITSNEERLPTPRPSRAVRPSTSPSRFSQGENEYGHSPSSSHDDITSPEAFMTPKEESGQGNGFFHQSQSRCDLKKSNGHFDHEIF